VRHQDELCDIVRSLNLRTFGLRNASWCPYREGYDGPEAPSITLWRNCAQPY
jgi:hypothetical protein